MADEMLQSNIKDAKLKLLEEGASSYLDALVAIGEFRREIWARSRKILNNRLRELSKAIECKLSESDVKDHDDYSGKDGWVAIEIKFDNGEGGFGISFDRDSSGRSVAYCTAWFSHSTKGDCQKILIKCQEIKNRFPYAELKDHGYNVEFREPISSEHMQLFDEKLDNLITVWIQVWQELGGVKKVFKS